MREFMLMIHFIGLAMGLGTSVGYMFLGIAASKLEKDEALKFTLNTFSFRRMGELGIILLVISGGYLITPYFPSLSSQPFLIAKLSLVAVLIVLIILLDIAAKKAIKGDIQKQLKKIQTMGKISLIIALAIVVLAVLNFR